MTGDRIDLAAMFGVEIGDRFRVARGRHGAGFMIATVTGFYFGREGKQYASVRRNTSRRTQGIQVQRLLSSAYMKLPHG